MRVSSLASLSILADLSPAPIYLVGGTVRDIVAGAENIRDIDLAMPSGSLEAARRFADAVGGSFFVLDEERRVARVVKPLDGGVLQFDFSDFERPDLLADLARRDFTVNSMALDLRGHIAGKGLAGLIDPFGGRQDVTDRVIRAADPQVLDDDPLRLLRAVRFAATLGFGIEHATAVHIRSRAALIARPSPERVRDELFLILSVPGADRHLGLLESLGLLAALLPELSPLRDYAPGKHHRYDILTHSIRTAGHVDAVLDALPGFAPAHAGAVRAHLAGMLEQQVSRLAALRFACLLHDAAKPETFSRGDDGDVHFFGHESIGAGRAADICERLRLSNETSSVVGRLVRHHMRPLNLSAPGGPSRRALYRYCRDLRDAAPESIVLSLADAAATAEAMPSEGFTDTRGTAAVILEYYYGAFRSAEARPFVTGRDLIARGMRPGPSFRGILEGIRERQAAGTLRDRREALAHLDELLRGGAA